MQNWDYNRLKLLSVRDAKRNGDADKAEEKTLFKLTAGPELIGLNSDLSYLSMGEE